MLVGQPVVLGISVLKVQVPLAALLLTEVSQAVRAVLSVAELEIVAQTRAGTAPVGRAGRESKGHAAWCHQEEASTQGATHGIWECPESRGSGAILLSGGTQPGGVSSASRSRPVLDSGWELRRQLGSSGIPLFRLFMSRHSAHLPPPQRVWLHVCHSLTSLRTAPVRNALAPQQRHRQVHLTDREWALAGQHLGGALGASESPFARRGRAKQNLRLEQKPCSVRDK